MLLLLMVGWGCWAVPWLASWSAISFPWVPEWPGTQDISTELCFAVSFSVLMHVCMVLASGNRDFSPYIVAWLSVWMIISCGLMFYDIIVLHAMVIACTSV